ncbi:hypothetical protein COEREDRAFT_41146 [Coemansia reversa NRRL 1564]|uniref:Prolyl endopeptidase n=1 Tax=Coemansia reversa (strain ATCC 12441 / NRRL 1564) TaxID=763665 RepID=A0A2G5BE94_COERN|nr:hypothetical protein COEREDRAFT_41146 [Coemansia reversa NRRL 1564]|eukprot:PIA17346.1 hypothetical protein COEREDRAFT_41146 [Coemansia reversa NRRL 1564]
MLYYTVLNDKLRAHKVLRHRIGQSQESDVEVYVENDHECFVDITRSKDKQFHIINSSTLDSSEVRVFPTNCVHKQMPSPDITPETQSQLLRPRQRGVEYFVDHHNGEFVILTNSPKDGSTNVPIKNSIPFRLMRASSTSPQFDSWTELLRVGEDERIEDVEIFRNYIMVSIKRHGRPAVIIHNRTSETNEEIKLPYGGECVVRPEPNPQFDSSTVRLGFSSPIHLDSVVEYDMSTLQPSQSWASTPLQINPCDYVIRHELVPGKGAQIPMTLIHQKSVLLSKTPPTLIRVYGAYGVSLEPEFRLEDIPLLRRGWIIALAHVRGGGELGREWYVGGKGHNKINSVNDLLSCAQFLLEKGWTTPEKLAVTGVSAGGLTAAAALNSAPEYFRAASLHVPFVDPLSAMLCPDLPLTGAETAEWGNPISSVADYTAIQKYSPYDNIGNMMATGLAPSILVTAGGQDQRVSVWQPAKWVARLRDRGGYSKNVSTNSKATLARVLFVTRMEEGHFHSKESSSYDESDGFVRAHSLRNAFLTRELSAPQNTF